MKGHRLVTIHRVTLKCAQTDPYIREFWDGSLKCGKVLCEIVRCGLSNRRHQELHRRCRWRSCCIERPWFVHSRLYPKGRSYWLVCRSIFCCCTAVLPKNDGWANGLYKGSSSYLRSNLQFDTFAKHASKWLQEFRFYLHCETLLEVDANNIVGHLRDPNVLESKRPRNECSAGWTMWGSDIFQGLFDRAGRCIRNNPRYQYCRRVLVSWILQVLTLRNKYGQIVHKFFRKILPWAPF